MRKLLCKMIPVIGIALLATSIVSCSNKDDQSDLPINTVQVPVEFSFSDRQLSEKTSKAILEKLKDIKYISGYTNAQPVVAFPFMFTKKNVKQSEVEKVNVELLAEAHKHYAEAKKAVDGFDFNTLVVEPIQFVSMAVYVKIEEKSYDIDITIQKPLIFDKAWATEVVGCPIKSIKFDNTKVPVSAELTLNEGDKVPSTKVVRIDANSISIKTKDFTYIFNIMSAERIKLIKYNKLDSKVVNVKDKNYFFEIK